MVTDTRYTEAIFNIAGNANAEFIEEVTNSQLIKKNEIYFALLVNGLPGEPDFGVGMSDMLAELNVRQLRRFIEQRIDNTLVDLVEGIKLNDYVIEQDPGNQFLGVDLIFTDLDSDKDVLIPIGFRQNK